MACRHALLSATSRIYPTIYRCLKKTPERNTLISLLLKLTKLVQRFPKSFRKGLVIRVEHFVHSNSTATTSANSIIVRVSLVTEVCLSTSDNPSSWNSIRLPRVKRQV